MQHRSARAQSYRGRGIHQWQCWLLMVALALPAGCRSRPEMQFDDPGQYFYPQESTAIETPLVDLEENTGVLSTPAPHTVRTGAPEERWPMTLQEAIQLALQNSEVIRDLNARVLQGPQAAPTVYDAAIRESDPLSGPEAALSAFDAQFDMAMLWERNERRSNNLLVGGGQRRASIDAAQFQAQISKTAATGTQFSATNTTTYDRSDLIFNQFPSSYDTLFELEAVHPLLQNGGVAFNRIVGPRGRPGQYNGVLIARINTDVTLADFEIAIRDLLNDVDRAYWDLYFAYRELETNIAGRDAALQTWRLVQRKLQVGTADEEQEARAREQYYSFQSQVIDALSGTAISGTFVATSRGVYSAERRLRSVLGLPASGDKLIQPVDQPLTAEAIFDWQESLALALLRRAELRRQKWVIKRRELELTGAANFLRMKLDLVGRYRWRGFGDQLLGNSDVPFGSAFADLFVNGRQEWTLGFQISTPIGNRIGHTAVRNAEWNLARERAVYREQELQVSHELAAAFNEIDRAYEATRSNYNRSVAARQQLKQVQRKYDAGTIDLEFVLDAQQRAVQAQIGYFRALIDYNRATARLSRTRGTLLEHYEVYLAEGPWSPQARRSAAKQSRRFVPHPINYSFIAPGPVSRGEFPQETGQAVPAPDAADSREEVVPFEAPPADEQKTLPTPEPAQQKENIPKALPVPTAEPNENPLRDIPDPRSESDEPPVIPPPDNGPPRQGVPPTDPAAEPGALIPTAGRSAAEDVLPVSWEQIELRPLPAVE